MERLDVGDDPRLNELVDSVAHGGELELIRDGKPVARLQATPSAGTGSLDRAALMHVRRRLLPLRVADGGKLIHSLRDSAGH